jgi:multiple sugar transport system substrate-binding protein
MALPTLRVSRYSKRLTFLFAATVILGPLLASSGRVEARPAASSVVHLVYWDWVPNIDKAIAIWNQTHPSIQVTLANVGGGSTEYTKLRTALKANSGAPDLVMLEYQFLPTFASIGGLVDLSKYGAAKASKLFTAGSWSQTVQGKRVYAIPQDTGPMAMLYRADLFRKYNLPVPKTWAQFSADAIAMHKADPNLHIADFMATQDDWLFGLMWQAGAQFFKGQGNDWTVHIDNQAAIKVANFWEKLVRAGAVSADSPWTPDWFNGFATGKYATFMPGAWGIDTLKENAAGTAGNWRVAELPQWKAGKHDTGMWGGAATAVTLQSKHPKEATEFAIWIDSNARALFPPGNKGLPLWWPASTAGLKVSKLYGHDSFYGGQEAGKVFASVSRHVVRGFVWSPFQDYVFSTLGTNLTDAVGGKMSFADALKKTQQQVVTFEQQQGYSIHG